MPVILKSFYIIYLVFNLIIDSIIIVVCLYFSDLALFIFMGGIGMFSGQLFYILGVINTTPDTASMFQPLVPVVCTIIAIVMQVEKPPNLTHRTGLAKVFGIALATCGALIMTYSKNVKHSLPTTTETPKTDENSLGEPSLYGYLYLFGNVSSASLWIVVQKKYIFNNSSSRWRQYPINVTAWTYFFGAAWMAWASLLYHGKDPSIFRIESWNVIYCLIYAIFVTSALCYVLITWCNMQVNSSFVTASWPLQVLFCLCLSYVVLGETLLLPELFGGVLIICALMLVTWSNFNDPDGGRKSPKIINGVLLR